MPSHPRRPDAQTSLSAFDPLGTFKIPVVDRKQPGATGMPSLAPARRGQTSADRADLLVIGNGIAGCVAAMETRKYAPDARIVVVTAQNYPTINTPALKQFGAGRLELDDLLAYSAGTEQSLGIQVMHQRATAIEPTRRRVRLADGSDIAYRSLLLATGSRASSLPERVPGRDFDGVLKLHTLEDYLDLRRRLPTTSAAVVVGGGYHAAETALLLRHQQINVTWLIRGRALLPRMLDAGASDLLLKQVRRQGVQVRLETEVAGVVGRMGTVAGVVTTENAFIPCDLVVTAIGAEPDVTLAQDAFLVAQPGQGLGVNQRLQTSARDVYAAGSVAAVLDPQTGRRETRGQWYFAMQQGRLAAASMAGAPIPASAGMSAVGAFWHATQLEKLSVLVAGAPMLTERDHPDNEVLTKGSGGCYRRVVVRHGHLVGYLAIGANLGGGLSLKRLIDERIDIEEVKRKLLDEDFNLRAFFTQRRLHALATGESGIIPKPVPERTHYSIAARKDARPA